MKRFHRLLAVLAGATRNDLRRQIQFLKAENEIMRRRLGCRVITTPAERTRLLRLGRPLGRALQHLITIVSPRTFAKWVSTAKKGPRPMKRKRGRPRTDAEIRDLVLRLATETSWGTTRILGELRKLGVRRISRSTVANILRTYRIPSAPDRGEGTWDQFIKSHAQTLWACDFVTKRILTAKGMIDAFVLVFIHIASRQVYASPATTKPNATWAAEQARDFARAAVEAGHPAGQLIHDNDTKMRTTFDTSLRSCGVQPVRIPFRAPDMNAYAERFVGTLQTECLDHFIPVGTGHLDYLVREFTSYYNARRPHSSLGFKAPTGPPPEEDPRKIEPGSVICDERLGGLIRHYRRQAA